MRMGKEKIMNMTKHNDGETRFQKLGRILASVPGLARRAEVAISNMAKCKCSEDDFRTFLLSYMHYARNKVHAHVASRLMQEFLPDVSRKTMEDLLVVELGMYTFLVDYDGMERVRRRIKKFSGSGKIGTEKFPFLKDSGAAMGYDCHGDAK